jgi:hypothetical protein
MTRTAFVIDGFNLYHSLVAASKSLGLPNETGTKWLDLKGLCASYLSALGGGATLSAVHYYSAFAYHIEPMKPGVVARHRAYKRCIEASGVTVEMGSFKKKFVECRHCGKTLKLREEKETDVAVGVKLLEILFRKEADRVVLVTGDTDVAPAVRAAQRMFPANEVCFAFPWRRRNEELAGYVKTCVDITREAYVRHQFSDPAEIGGKKYAKPATW